MAQQQRIIFYDLVAEHGGPFFSPNTLKTRFSLLHKGVDFEEREVTFMELREMGPKMGLERAIIPCIELPDGSFIYDSWNIAEWLEKEYPDKPSLFLPDSPTPLKAGAPELTVAKNFALVFSEGFGSSDAQWSTFFEISAQGIYDLMPGTEETNPNKAYFRSDYKLGMKGAWEWLQSLDRETLISHAQASLIPLDKILSKTPFLSGNNPGFADYVAFGRYYMMRCACPKECKTVWLRPETLPHVAEWVERLDKRWEKEMTDATKRLPPL
ncbi:Beta-etherase [Rhodotorula toruloides]|nr:Beta-etherase [Rhodotorula toruloides]